MKVESFVLDERYPDCKLSAHILDGGEVRRAILIMPGGAYARISSREGEPIAKYYLSKGFNCFVLRYSVGERAVDRAPLIEAALAIKHIRENADKYRVDPDKIFVCGFSAGGHLAASSGILWNDPTVRKALGDSPDGINKPTGMILSYPVITSGELAHKGSIYNLCGTDKPTEEQMNRYSLERYVDSTTPPAFIWHTFTDDVVPVENSLMLAEKMSACKVPFELHVFPDGEHGLALANETSCPSGLAPTVAHAAIWTELSVRWINTFF